MQTIQNVEKLPECFSDFMHSHQDIFVRDFETETKTTRYAGEYACILPNVTYDQMRKMYSQIDESTYNDLEVKRNSLSMSFIYSYENNKI